MTRSAQPPGSGLEQQESPNSRTAISVRSGPTRRARHCLAPALATQRVRPIGVHPQEVSRLWTAAGVLLSSGCGAKLLKMMSQHLSLRMVASNSADASRSNHSAEEDKERLGHEHWSRAKQIQEGTREADRA